MTWDAVNAPQSAGATLPLGSENFGKGHYNQGGRIRGTIGLSGSSNPETLNVDCFYARDHSWGPRNFTNNPRGDFASAMASENSGFCALAASDQPRATDPCVGVPDPVLFGWYLRDGETSRPTSAHRTVTQRGPDGLCSPAVVGPLAHVLGHELVVWLTDGGLEQLRLAAEVAVDGGLVDAGLQRDVAGGGGRVTTLGEQVPGRGTDQLADRRRRPPPAPLRPGYSLLSRRVSRRRLRCSLFGQGGGHLSSVRRRAPHPADRP